MVSDPLEWAGTEVMEACTHEDCEHHLWPNGYALLQIDMQLMTEEQQRQLRDGLDLLRQAGVDFDTGIGGAAYDVELDWSLRGAQITVGGLYCMATNCPNQPPEGKRDLRNRPGINPAFWSVYELEGDTWSRPYCSEECRSRADLEAIERPRPPAGYEGPLTIDDPIENPRFATLLLHDVAEALKRES